MVQNVRNRLTAMRSSLKASWQRGSDKARQLASRLRHAMGPGLRAALQHLRGGWQRLRTGMRRLPAQMLHLGRQLPSQLRRGVQSVLRFRPSPRVWTVVVALVALPVGAGLTITPIRELATGRSLGLQGLLTGAWLLTGAMTFAAALGILLRAPSFRPLLWGAFVCSLALPAAFGYRTFRLFVQMRTSTGPDADALRPWVTGGLQLSLLFAAVTGFLFFMTRFRPLRSLPCQGRFLAGRTGTVLGIGMAGALGGAAGYGLWLGSYWLGVTMNVSGFRTALQVLRVDHFVAAGAVLAATGRAGWQLWRRRATGPRRAGSPAAAPRPAAAARTPVPGNGPPTAAGLPRHSQTSTLSGAP